MKRIIMWVVVLCGIIAFLPAEDVKIGFFDGDRIKVGSNEIAEAERLFMLDRMKWGRQLKDLDDSITQMENQFKIKELSINEAAKKDYKLKITNKKAEYDSLLYTYFGEGGEAEKRHDELMAPISEKLAVIIQKMAEDEKYSVIFDVSMGFIIYADPKLDLTDIILLELNKDTLPPPGENLTPEQPKEEDPLIPNPKEDVFTPKEDDKP